ncbi:MAG: AI-2E family transporter, partial [Gallicola sp.]|nr:AI-2E family transporter [Gallicola sp.]
MNIRKNDQKNILKIGGALIILAFVLFKFSVVKTGLSTVLKIIAPFLIGAVITLFISVPLEAVEVRVRNRFFRNSDNKGLYRGIALIITLLIIILFMYFAFSSVIPDLIEVISTFIDALPQVLNDILNWFEGLNTEDMEFIDGLRQDFAEISEDIKASLQRGARNILMGGVSVVTGTFSFVFTAFLALSFSIYLIFYQETLVEQIRKALYAFFSRDTAQVIMITASRFSNSFSSFIGGLTFASVIYGIMNFIGMLILGMPYRTTLSFLAVLLNFVPYFGPFLAGFIGFILVGALDLQQGLVFII